MTITKETFVDLEEKYEKVRKLLEEDSKLDPATEPYLSKYNARQLLIGMKASIENLLRGQVQDTKEHLKLTAMLGATLLLLGVVSIETEELSTGEKYLNKCEEVVEKYEIKPEVIIIHLRVLNETGLLWSEKEPEKAKSYLEKAQLLYKQFKDSEAQPLDIPLLFLINPPSNSHELSLKSFEKQHTLTLYYLAQIYGALGDTLRSAVFCHVTLKRQYHSDDYEPVDWALNAATLSQFFMEKNGFKQARHHLAVSSYMLQKYEQQLNAAAEHNEEHEAKEENFKHRSADIGRCWAKYGLLLLANSRDRLLKHTDDININCNASTDLTKLPLTSEDTVSAEELQNLCFTALDVSRIEEQITDQFILTLEDGKEVFHNIKSWLQKAHAYYTLDNLASDYIEIVQDQAQAYLNLSFFEDNVENQAKMHKRRVDLLENVLKEVNPTYYMSYCRQMWYEIGQSYGEILQIKLDKLKEMQGRPNPQTLTKINNLADKSLRHYTNFINSFRDLNTQKLPKTIVKEYQKPFLQAYFNIGALHSRSITLDKRVILDHVKLSLEAYKCVVDYCKENPTAEELIPAELSICKEMIALLPVKIIKLREEIS